MLKKLLITKIVISIPWKTDQFCEKLETMERLTPSTTKYYFSKMQSYFLMLFAINVVFLYETVLIQWTFSQHGRYWLNAKLFYVFIFYLFILFYFYLFIYFFFGGRGGSSRTHADGNSNKKIWYFIHNAQFKLMSLTLKIIFSCLNYPNGSWEASKIIFHSLKHHYDIQDNF